MNDNYDLAEIKTLEDAKSAWESFFGRFFSPDIPPEVNVDFNSDLREFTPRKNKDAKYAPPGSSEGRTLHSDDFDDFLNGNTITIPEHIALNAEGLDKVAQAIQQGNFEHEALKKEDHTFYALWLFRQNKITRQQMATILARDQVPKEYPITNTFHILDDRGRFTKEALDLWLPTVVENAFGGKFTKWQLERLRLLIQASPKSEQIFYISECDPNAVGLYARQLGNALQINHTWPRTIYNKKRYDLHMSFGVLEGMQIAVSGINGAAASRAKIGKVAIDAVKEGVEYYYRPTAISMRNSGVEATTKGIHGYANSPMPAVTTHDVFHSRLHNTIRPEFHMMLNHMNQIISKHTKQKWSKTMWELVDREFHAFQYRKIDLNSKNGAKLFLEMLHRNDDDHAFLFRNHDPQQLSDDGFAIVWNMVNQSAVWKNLYKVDVDRLGFPYGPLIEKMKAFKKEAGSDHKHSEILTLKYRLYDVTTKTEFRKVCKLLDTLGERLVTDKDQKLVFGKYAQGMDKNLTSLKFKNFGTEVLIDEKSAKQLIPTLVNMQLISLFGEKNDKAVYDEMQKISGEFKSTHQNSTFSKALLDTSIRTLPSITAKLDFLEACYEEIIHSKGYTRRHATADNLFAFFKNPLTTSQREHIILLKETLNELVTEYQEKNSLGEKDNAELQWYMNNRGSNLSLCNTDRFYLHMDSTIASAKI